MPPVTATVLTALAVVYGLNLQRLSSTPLSAAIPRRAAGTEFTARARCCSPTARSQTTHRQLRQALVSKELVAPLRSGTPSSPATVAPVVQTLMVLSLLWGIT